VTFRLVIEYLNQLRYRVPHVSTVHLLMWRGPYALSDYGAKPRSRSSSALGILLLCHGDLGENRTSPRNLSTKARGNIAEGLDLYMQSPLFVKNQFSKASVWLRVE
jgi:hypothetical protein